MQLTNILVDFERWAFGRKRKDVLEIGFIRTLHKRMFGDTWRWAGSFHTTDKNIGVDPLRIQPALHDLVKDVQAQLQHRSYPPSCQQPTVTRRAGEDGKVT